MLNVPARERLSRIHHVLGHGLVDRDVAARLLLLAAVAGEHALLIGPPGTGKSLLARRLAGVFREGRWFERLLTRFSVPEELFGPLSIRALEEDRYVRKTDRYLPTATVAFLDEIFKANSAILNALLTILNERCFDNDGQRVGVPLATLVGASNELPEGDELAALYDRFLLRLHVEPVRDGDFPMLLASGGDGVDLTIDDRLAPGDVEAVNAAARCVVVPSPVVELLAELRTFLRAKGIAVSDRRWLRIVRLLRVAAVTDGRSEVSPWDLWLVQHCAWQKPEQRELVFDWYAQRVAAWGVRQPERLSRLVSKWEHHVEQLASQQAQQRDAKGRLLFKRPDGEPHDAAKWVGPDARDARRFHAPDGARRGYHNVDVKNGGSGWSLQELDAMTVPEGGAFSDWNQRKKWLADPKNMITREHTLPALLGPLRHSRVAIENIERQVTTVEAELAAHLAWLDDRLREANVAIANHPWVPDSFAEVASLGLSRQREHVLTLSTRLQAVRTRIRALPLEAELPDEVDEHDVARGVSA